MGTPCEGCAFGGDAGKEPYNALRGEICATSGVPFFCHHGLDWQQPIGIMKGQAFDLHGTVQPVKLCAGWQARVKELPRPASGFQRIFRKAQGQFALDLLEEAIATKDDTRKEIWDRLGRVVKSLRKFAKEKVTV